MPPSASLEVLPEPVRQHRNQLWHILEDSAEHSQRKRLDRDLFLSIAKLDV